MRHEARQVPSWLIFDVGQKRYPMNKIFVVATFACLASPVAALEARGDAALADLHARAARLVQPKAAHWQQGPARGGCSLQGSRQGGGRGPLKGRPSIPLRRA